MKKTLITLLALGGLACGADSFTSTKTATIALTFNVDALESISDVNFTGNGSTKPNFFMFTGSWANDVAGQLGLANNGSSGSDTTGVWSSWVKGDSSGQATDTGLGAIFTSSTNWDNIGAVSLVYSFSTPETGATTVNTAITIAYLDGTAASTAGETKSNIVFNGVSGFAATGIEVNETFVKNYEVSSVYTTLNDAKVMSVALIPEPTTATLSLLALAGLAARRRRS